MKNITCLIGKKGLLLYRNGKQVGIVTEIKDEPTIELGVGHGDASIQLTFNDIAVIEDCWNFYVNQDVIKTVDKLLGHDIIGL